MEDKRRAQVFRKLSKYRDMRMAKSVSAREAIGKIEKGSDTYILTFGQFSYIDALVAILDQTGPADVAISTWTAADAHLERSATMLERAQIKRFRMIVDHSFEYRQPKYFQHMINLFGVDCIRALRTHTKFGLVRSDTHSIVIRTSMNLNENPRLENIEISEDRAFADFMGRVVDEIFAEVKVGERKGSQLKLVEIPESYPFKEVEGGTIDERKLNEAKATHTLKKL